jgi:hypothetical protein
MQNLPPAQKRETARKALFICGSVNQTRQLHAISQQLAGEIDPHFTVYYCDGFLEKLRRARLCDFCILGWPWRKESLRYLKKHQLKIDHEGSRLGVDYDLVVTCSDVVMPRNILDKPVVLVQEGIIDPRGFWYWARRLLPFLVPRWGAGTANTGTSNLYDRFCVASEGYRDHFVKEGADPEKIVITGIPNFDDCARYRKNDFPLHDFVLVCTSDARETLKFDYRRRFIRRAVDIASGHGKPLVFKLHPNEDWDRATREIARWAPGAQVFTKGSAEEMVANAAVVICQYSTLAFVAMALGKEVHSYFPLEELRRLLPIQGGGAAARIAEVCRGLLAEGPKRQAAGVEPALASEPAGWTGWGGRL